jgi:hypothetical protein
VAATLQRGGQIADGSIQRVDLDVTTAGQAVVRRVIAGTGITFVSTGADAGTGDVTINASGGGGSPAGATKELQYNNAGAFAGAANVEIDNGDLCLVVGAAPATPPALNVKLFAKSLAGRILPASVGPSGLDAALQPSTWRQKIGRWNPAGNSTTVPSVDGLNAYTALGTATARTVATTNLMTRTRRLSYVSAATAAGFAGHYSTVAQFTTGDGAGLGGFFYSRRFAASDAAAVAGVREFVGLSSSVAAPTNVEANTLTNCVGVAQLSTDTTQMYLVYGGSTAQAAIALGTNFPPMTAAGASNGVMYDLTLFAAPSANGVIGYRLERVGTAFVAEGTLTPGTPGLQTPLNTTLLADRAWRCNNATLLACSIDLINIYVETDY